MTVYYVLRREWITEVQGEERIIRIRSREKDSTRSVYIETLIDGSERDRATFTDPILPAGH